MFRGACVWVLCVRLRKGVVLVRRHVQLMGNRLMWWGDTLERDCLGFVLMSIHTHTSEPTEILCVYVFIYAKSAQFNLKHKERHYGVSANKWVYIVIYF